MSLFSRRRMTALAASTVAAAGAAALLTVGSASLAHADAPNPTPTNLGPSPTPTFHGPTATPTIQLPTPTQTPTRTPTQTPTTNPATPTPCASPNFFDTYCYPAAPPTGLTATYVTSTSASFTWSSKSGVTPYPTTPLYELFLADGTKVASTTGLTATVSGLAPDTEYTVRVRARLSDLNPYSSSDPLTFTTLPDGAPSPTPGPMNVPAPKNLRASGITDNSLTLEWDDGGIATPVASPGYEIYTVDANGDRTLKFIANGTGKAIGGLYPGTTYTFVVADQLLVGKQYSAPLTVTTTGTAPTSTTSNYEYRLVGAASLKTLVKGTMQLTGSASATVSSTGHFTASLTLNQTTAGLTALGFLPVVAKVNIVPTQAADGTLSSGVVNATTWARIKVPSITVFGAQVAGGASCQTTQLSTIPLKSVNAFTPASGGNLAGTFSISNLSGCGALTGVVSPLTAGGGNSILLKFTT